MKKIDLQSFVKVNKAEAEKFKKNSRKRSEKLMRHFVKFMKVFLVIVIIIGLFFTAAKQFANVSMSNMTDWIKGVFLKASPGEGYPYTISGNGVIQSVPVGPYLALVEKDKLVFLNSHAKDIFVYEHNFVDPVLKSKNGRAVFYCEDTSDFVITSSSEILFGYDKTSKVLDGGIITADIGRKGNIAFACWASDYTCKISVFNQKLNEVFYYAFSSGRVADMSLSDDGKYLCAAVIDAENASLFTRLIVFDLSKDNPVADLKLSNQTGVDIEFLSGKNIELVTLAGVYNYNFLSDDKPTLILDYSGGDLEHVSFDNSSGRFTLAVKLFSEGKNTIFLFDKSGTKYKSVETDYVKKIYRSSRYTCCLMDHKIFCLKNNSKQLFEFDPNVNVDDIVTDYGRMYIFSGNQIYKVALTRFTDLELN